MSSKYAVVKTGGKQYRVAEGDTVKVEKLAGQPGDKIALDQVLMVVDAGAVTVGKPTVAGAQVEAEIVEESRAAKIIVFKSRRRKRYRRKAGHRQTLTTLKVNNIQLQA